MMISAFGVDHGLIEKSVLSGIGTGLAGMTRGLGSSMSRGGAGLRRAARPGTGARMATPGQVNKPMQALGAGMGKAGGQLRRLGGGMAQRPGLTGGIAAGTGAAGLGGGAALLGNRRRQ